MKEFVSAALPWLLTGIALAILAVNHGMENQKDGKRRARIAMGAGFGLLLGVVLNSCGLWESHVSWALCWDLCGEWRWGLCTGRRTRIPLQMRNSSDTLFPLSRRHRLTAQPKTAPTGHVKNASGRTLKHKQARSSQLRA